MLEESKTSEAPAETKVRKGDRGSKKSANNMRDRSPLSKGRKQGIEKRVYVSNIPYEYRWQDLKDLFRNEVGEVSYVELFMDENDKPRGCGIVEFENAELAQSAVEKMHRYELKGRKLVVKEDGSVDRDKQGRPLGFGGRSVNSGHINRNQWIDSNKSSTTWGTTYGLSPQFLESLSIQGPLINKVFVANLDYKVDEKKLQQVFKLAGRVINVELLMDKEGKSRGFGTVEFEHPVEAVQAISMLHNQLLYDRRINVRMDRSNELPDGPLKLPEGLKSVGMGLGANGAPLTDVAKNLPSLNLSDVQPVSNNLTASAPSALAAIVSSLNLDRNLIDNALARRQLEMNLSSSLLNNATAADFSSLTSATLSNSFGAGLGVNNSTSVTGSAFLGGGNSFEGSGAGIGGRSYDSLAALASSNSKLMNSLDRLSSVTLGQRDRHSDTVVIKNLPPQTTWKMLRDRFREAGDIKFAEMKGRDSGLIRFASEQDANRAVSIFDNYRVDGRLLSVELR